MRKALPLEAGIWVLLFMTPLLFLPYLFSEMFFTPKHAFVLLLGGGLVVTWRLSRAQRTMPLVRTGLEAPLLVVAGASLLSILLNSDPLPLLFPYLSLLSHIALFYLFTSYWKTRRRKGLDSGPLRVCFWAGVLAAIYVHCQSHGLDFFRFEGGVPDWRGKLTSTFGGPNFVGGYLAMVVPIGLWTVGRAKGRAVVIPLLGVTLVLGALVVAWVFGAWTGLWGAGLVLMWSRRFRERIFRAKSLFPLGLFLVVCAWFLLPNPYNAVKRSLFSEAFASERWRTGGGARAFIWKTTSLMLQDHPFRGIGFGNYYRVHQIYQGRHYAERGTYHDRAFVSNVPQVHNEYYQQAVETGLPGTFALFWLIAAGIRLGRKRVKQAPDSHAGDLYVSSAGMIVAGIHALQSFPTRIPSNALLFLFLAAHLYGYGNPEGGGPDEMPKKGKRVRGDIWILLSAVLGIYSGLCILVSQIMLGPPTRYPERRLDRIALAAGIHPFSIEARERLLDAYLGAGDWAKALETSEEALRLRENQLIRMRRVDLLLRLGRPDEAVEEGRRVVALNPAYAPLLVGQAHLERRTGNYEEANELEARAEFFLRQIAWEGREEILIQQLDAIGPTHPEIKKSVLEYYRSVLKRSRGEM